MYGKKLRLECKGFTQNQERQASVELNSNSSLNLKLNLPLLFNRKTNLFKNIHSNSITDRKIRPNNNSLDNTLFINNRKIPICESSVDRNFSIVKRLKSPIKGSYTHRVIIRKKFSVGMPENHSPQKDGKDSINGPKFQDLMDSQQPRDNYKKRYVKFRPKCPYFELQNINNKDSYPNNFNVAHKPKPKIFYTKNCNFQQKN